MKDAAFLRLYKRLNNGQRAAVDAIEGPVMVIAGPGTGKTSVLTLRIANILRKTDTPANGILALTFTESAVHSMRTKLVELIGSQAYRVHLYTFHGFAQEIISRYPEYFPRIIGGSVASESDRLSMLENALAENGFEIIKPFGKPYLYVPKALAVIKDLKRDTVSPAGFKKLLEKQKKELGKAPGRFHESGRLKGELKKEHLDALRDNAKNLELSRLYASYEASLQERHQYDFEDMLVELVEGLRKHADLRRILQEEYLYVLADEHQDANNAQNAVLELLTDYRDTRNLFIVGDEKQAIYRFQGASLQNFLYFKGKYPEAQTVLLSENYRSTQNILDASHALMKTEKGEHRLRPPLKASGVYKNAEEKISFTVYETEEDERHGIAEDIALAVRQGCPADDIAVLVRTNAAIAPLGETLSGRGIPYTLFSEEDVLSDYDMEKLLRLLRAVTNPHNDGLVGSALLMDFLGLHPMDAVRLNRRATETRRSPAELIIRPHGPKELIEPLSADRFARHFIRWIRLAATNNAADAFLSVVHESGFEEHLVKSPSALEKLSKLSRLYDEIKHFMVAHKDARLTDFIDAMETLRRHGSPLSFMRSKPNVVGVSILTAHKAKGLEWERVYVAHAADRIWGNRRTVGTFHLPPPLSSAGESEYDEDERRLFYVAVTRAKKSVRLSYARFDRNGKERLPSRFIEELPAEHVERLSGKSAVAHERLTRAVTSATAKHPRWDKRELASLFEEQGLTATALNNYVECPWKYFFRNLVRLPDIPSKSLSFGSAVHAALKRLGDARREDKRFAEKDFVDAFERELERSPLSRSDLDESVRKGRRILPLYFKARNPGWHKNALTEYAITGVFLPISRRKNLLLRGRLDRIDLLPGGKVNVVDYKTGNHHTRNDILGKTKTSDGNIKRQLDFYRLLLELHDNGRLDMESADVDFVEPDRRGNMTTPEHFEMSHADAKSVSEIIVTSANEIATLSFWDTRCDKRDCEFCGLRGLLD